MTVPAGPASAGAAAVVARPCDDVTGDLERLLQAQGFAAVAGVDEAGRGALAGPLVAAAVVLPPGVVPDGLRDSKLLTPLQRDRLYARIRGVALGVGVVRVTPGRLDRIGLQAANVRALSGAVAKLRRGAARPDYVLVDGRFRFRCGSPSLRIVKGDRVSAAIAAASVIAKVTRDRTMVRLARRHPGYGFERHKGYAVAEHVDALDRLGPSDAHRRCFVSVAQRLLDDPSAVDDWDDVPWFEPGDG